MLVNFLRTTKPQPPRESEEACESGQISARPAPARSLVLKSPYVSTVITGASKPASDQHLKAGDLSII